MPKVNQLTPQERAAIVDKSPLSFPNNPTQSGFSAGQIKQKLSGMVTDTEDSVLAILDEKLEEIDDAFTDTDGDVTAINGRLTTVEGKVSTLEGQNLNTRLTTAESDINQLESDVLGLDNTKTDLTYTNAQLALKANIASPTFTGTPLAPTAVAGTNTTQLATTAFVETAVSTLENYTDNELASKIDLTQKGAVNGVADLDSQGKIKVAQLPNSVFDNLRFVSTIFGSATLRSLTMSAVANANGSNRSPVGLYYVAGHSMNVTNNFTAVSITQGPVTAWVKTFFTPADNGNSYTTSDITDTLESGDWIVITRFEGVGTEADPYVVYFGVVENTYENATTDIDGIVRLSGSTSTATTGNNVVTDTVINALVGDTSTKLGRGDYAKAGYDHSIITNGTNPHNTTFANVASKPTTIGGFGITDAYTMTESDLRRNYIRNIFNLLQPYPNTINPNTYTPTIYLTSNFPLPAPNVLIPGGFGYFIVVKDDDELTDISLGLWFWDGTQWILLPGGEDPFATNYLYSVKFQDPVTNYDFKCFYQLETPDSPSSPNIFRRMDNRFLSKEQFAAVDNQLDRVTNLKEIQVFQVNNESDFPNTISGQYIIADGDIGDGRGLWRKINSLSSQSVENWELVSGDGDLNKFIFRKGPNSQFALAESKDLYIYRYNPDTEEEEFVLVSLPDEILKDVNIVNAEEPTNVSAVDSKKLSLKGKVLVEQTTPVQVNLAGTSLPHDLVFGNNGTRLYVVDSSTDLIYQYNLATAFLPTSAELLNPSQTFNVSVQDASPLGIDIKPDGTAIFVMGSTNRRVIRYNLSTPFNVSTATFDSWSNQIPNSGDTLQSVRFKPDGTRFYVLNSTDDTVEVFDLTTPWNVTTNQFLAAFSIATQETTATGIAFNNDGTKMFIIGSLNDTVYQYNMTSAWGTNATYANKSVLFNENTPNGLTFNADGSRLFVVGSTTDSIKYFDLFTPFDVTSTSKQFKEGYYLKTKNVTTVNATLELGYTLENSADVPIWSIEKNGTVKIPQIKDSTNSVGSNGQALMKVGGTLTWASPQGLTSQTITIGVADWVANSATKTVTGVTASNIVWISPTATSYLVFSNTQIRATIQGTNSLTFACTTTPTQNVDVVVVIGG